MGVRREGPPVCPDGIAHAALYFIDIRHAGIGRLKILLERRRFPEELKRFRIPLSFCVNPAKVVGGHERGGVLPALGRERLDRLIVLLLLNVEQPKIDIGVVQLRVEGERLAIRVRRLGILLFIRVDAGQQQKGLGIVGSAGHGLPGIEHGLVELPLLQRERGQRQQDCRGALVKRVRGLVFAESLMQLPALFKQACRHKVLVGLGLRASLGAHAAGLDTGHTGQRGGAGCAQKRQR